MHLSNRRLIRLSLAAVAVLTVARSLSAQEDPEERAPAQVAPDRSHVPFVRTEGPRATIESFVRLRSEVEEAHISYRSTHSREDYQRIMSIYWLFIELIDLSDVALSYRETVAAATVDNLIDVFARIDLPPRDEIPAADAFDARQGAAKWRIPETPFWIVRVSEGPREGEFLFGPLTVKQAPVFLERIRHLPLRPSELGDLAEEIRQLTGPMIPQWLANVIPKPLRRSVLGSPAWKLLLVIALVAGAVALLLVLHRFLRRRGTRAAVAIMPLAIIVVMGALGYLVLYQINIDPTTARFVLLGLDVVLWIAAAWLFWLTVSIVLRPRRAQTSLDAGLVSLVARLVGVAGVVVILAFGAQSLGLPALSVLTGLGIGGLVVGLAIRPTLENIFGALAMYVDRPIRVGDMCETGAWRGLVEDIGVQSTRIRMSADSDVFIPNSQFAVTPIKRLAPRGRMPLAISIGLSEATRPEQLDAVLAAFRKMIDAHPKIDRSTTRVRSGGFGDSSLKLDLQVFVRTADWVDFDTVREDLLHRIREILAECGAKFSLECPE